MAMRRDTLGYLTYLARTYGDVSRFRLASQEAYLVAHPDLVRDVLVTQQRSFKKGLALERARLVLGDGLLTAEGEEHLRNRRMIQPEFHRRRIDGFAQVMVSLAERRSRGWTPNGELDMHREMSALALAIAGMTLFGADVEREAREVGDALETTFNAFMQTFFLPWGELLLYLPLPISLRFKRAQKRLESLIYRMIAERRASGVDAGDLLSMLLRARDAEGDGTGFTDQQIRDEALTIFLAGHETTANALTWTWYLLSQNPEAESRLHAEVDALGGRPPTLDDLPRLSYTRMVFAESMRLYPPAYAIGRRALEDVEIGGFRIPSRALVLVSEWVTHRDSRWWPDPERFDPERFDPERSAARPKFAYFPFGGGSRLCIGEHFAWLEGVLVLATIAQRWQARLAPGAVVQPRPSFTLRPRGGIRMRLEARG